MSATPIPITPGTATTVGAGQQANEVFLRYAPAVRTHAAIQFRHLPESDREEAVAEAVAAAFVNVHTAIGSGQSHRMTPSTVARFAVLHVKDGRHVGGSTNGNNDVLSRKAQWRRGFKVLGLSWDGNYAYDCLTDPISPVWKQVLLEDRRTSVPDQAVFRIDWSTFLRNQHPRTRRALAMLAQGHKQTQVADRMGVTPSAINQRIRRAEREWTCFQQVDAAPAQPDHHIAAQPAT